MIDHQHIQWLVCAALLTVAGCVGFDSTHSLSDPNEAKPDQRLIGEWASKQAKDVTYTVSLAGEGFPAGMHRLVIVDGKESDTGYFFVSEIGEDRYLNLANFSESEPLPEKWDVSKVTHFNLLGYRVVDNQWQLVPLNEEFVKQAIQQKQIKGEVVQDEAIDDPLLNDLFADTPAEKDAADVKPGELGEIDMRLTGSTAELRAFFKTHKDKILSKEFEPLERKKSTPVK